MDIYNTATTIVTGIFAKNNFANGNISPMTIIKEHNVLDTNALKQLS